VNAVVSEWAAARTVAEITGLLLAAGLPVAEVRTYAGAAADPHVRARGMLQDTVHADGSVLPITGPAAKFSLTPTRVRTPAPPLGAHSDEILAELGYDADHIARLRAAGPRSRALGRQAIAARSVASSIAGKRRSSVPTAISASMRASGAPRQKWIPWPKARWGFSSRLTSNSSAAGKRCPSRLADPSMATTTLPAGMTTPPTSTSVLATRSVDCITGPTKRSISSTATRRSSGYSWRRRRCSGQSNRARTALPMRLPVVS